MKFSRLLSAPLIALAALACAAAYAQEPTGPQPPLPAVQLQSGMYLIKAEVAKVDDTRMIGLMGRKQMAANEGMLFLFPDLRQQCMWMKNTLLPLSVAFMDKDGVILNIEDMKPQTEDSHCSAKPSPYALEMNLNWFRQKGLKAGNRITGLERAGKAE